MIGAKFLSGLVLEAKVGSDCIILVYMLIFCVSPFFLS